MAMNVTTKDTTALSDAELAEMADLCVDREPNFDIGFLSKQREDWVLVTKYARGTSCAATRSAHSNESAGRRHCSWALAGRP